MTGPDVPFGLSPLPRMYGVFEYQAQVETLRGTLGKLGFSASEKTVLEGQSGIRTLDLSGEQGGLAKRVLRFEERLTDERREIGKYIQALARGRWVVLVNMPHDDTETKERLHRAFQQAGASSIDYFGHLLNEELKV